MEAPRAGEIQRRLLTWFDAGHRDLPWRRTADPYRILLAEYLLQRTRVVSGTPYYERFLERFPDVNALAAASEEDVIRVWEGLGFYRRARNLHAAAKVIAREHGGRIPSDAAALAALPGVGPYTAGAVASIAFAERVAAVDGNATRVLSRLFCIEEDVTRPLGHRKIQQIAEDLVPADRPGAFNQALMELGATVCTPRRPACPTCPLGELCLARKTRRQSFLPRMPKPRKPKTVAVCFAYISSRGRVLLVRRGESDLLGGLWSLPGGEVPSGVNGRAALGEFVSSQTGLRVSIQEEVARVAHTFSHRRWIGTVVRCLPQGRIRVSSNVRWVAPGEAHRLPLVPAHRKVIQQVATLRPLESFGQTVRTSPR